ncbi:MAG: CvpA family protein [Dysosmobacter sp.]|nr:CvpA family protein [Dysosmobacter sp.]
MSTTAIILDILTAAALIAFTVAGAHRGFFRTVAGLLAVILALVGAQLFTNWAAPHVSGVLQPAIERRVEKKVDAALGGGSSVITPQEPQIGASRPDSETQDQKTEEESQIQSLLRAIGVDEQLFRRLGDQAMGKIRDTGVTVATAVVQSVAETAIRALLFLLSFVVFLLLLKLLAKVLDLALKLPVLRGMNGLAGAGVGLVEGILAIFLAIWLLRRLGVSFETPTVEGTYLLSFFSQHTPLSALASVGTRG